MGKYKIIVVHVERSDAMPPCGDDDSQVIGSQSVVTSADKGPISAAARAVDTDD